MKKLYIIPCIILLFTTSLFGQDHLKNIIPASPNAAEMARYGEVPVGYFTGVPNISVPLYHIKTNNFDLPLGLNYHSGGNKVEAIASWVGLGWSLSSIPTITRSVNGIPDEGIGGFFSKYYGRTVKQLIDEKMNGIGTYYDNFLRAVQDGSDDPEPDIFFYSLNGKSGKFYYDQVQEKFVTMPKENVDIKWNGTSFTITSDNGDRYYFTELETSQRNGSSQGTNVVTSWCVSKIENAARTENITFSYSTETQTSLQYTAFTKYQFLFGEVCYGAFNQVPTSPTSGENNQSILATTIVSAKLPSSIHFKGGQVKFYAGTSRADLNGGYLLDSIAVFTSNNKPVKKYKFNYSYLTGTGGQNCNASDTYSMKWLFLERVRQLSVNEGKHLDHTFSYNGTVPPCRTSTAQDYWGYYNGKNYNSTLVPTTNTTLDDNFIQIQGADRSVNPAFSNFGVLTKITYPTGGYAEFEFENHSVSAREVPENFITRMVSLEGEETPTTNTYQTTFVINNPVDRFLNNNNPAGGAFIDVNYGGLGCDFSNGATPCASISLQRLDNMQYVFLNNDPSVKGHYVPNGTYEMRISFDTTYNPPPDYSSFFYMVTYREVDSSIMNKLAGGLRVKEIRSYTDPSSSPLKKRYRYTDALESSVSSGDILGAPHFNYQDYLVYTSKCPLPNIPEATVFLKAVYLRIKAYSNVQQVTHSGSYVGYGKVFVETEDVNSSGFSMYTFDLVRDIGVTSFPYPPAQNAEAFRGNLLSETHYKRQGGGNWPVKRIINTYNPVLLENPVVYAMKAGYESISNDPDLYPFPTVKPYEIKTAWATKLTQKKETLYNGTDTTKFIVATTDYQYDETYRLLTSVQSTTSDNGILETQFRYPKDYTFFPYDTLMRRNIVTPVIEEAVFKNGSHVQTSKTNYTKWANSNSILPNRVQNSLGGDSLVTQVVFKSYDEKGNILVAGNSGGVDISYLWGYDQSLPIAQVQNAPYKHVFYSGVEDHTGWDSSMQYDSIRTYTGRVAGKIVNNGQPEVVSHSTQWLQVSLTAKKKFRYSVWYYSEGPAAGIFLLMKRAGETGYYSDHTGKSETGKWVLLEKEFEVPADVTQLGIRLDNNGTGTVWFDDVRLYPADAHMTTYTHDPLVGVTSVTDLNGKTQYYEYDGLGRLKLVRDQDGYILKQHEYIYRNQ